MYADDRRPPHFLIVGANFQVQVQISNLSIFAGKARAILIAEALIWAEEHQDELALKWIELNERD
jgi:hypothetical protein